MNWINGKIEVGKLMRVFRFKRPTLYYGYNRGAGWYELEFGVFRVTALPDEGGIFVHGKHYRGFWSVVHVWFPFEVERWR